MSHYDQRGVPVDPANCQSATLRPPRYCWACQLDGVKAMNCHKCKTPYKSGTYDFDLMWAPFGKKELVAVCALHVRKYAINGWTSHRRLSTDPCPNAGCSGQAWYPLRYLLTNQREDMCFEHAATALLRFTHDPVMRDEWKGVVGTLTCLCGAPLEARAVLDHPPAEDELVERFGCAKCIQNYVDNGPYEFDRWLDGLPSTTGDE